MKQKHFAMSGVTAFAFSAAMSCVSCTKPTLVQTLTAVEEGLAVGCSSEWVDAKTCTIVNDGFDLSISAAKKDGDAAKPQVRKLLKDIDAALPADSHAHEYIDWVFPFLL